MKQLLSLLLIISITILSWSSCAKNNPIQQVNTKSFVMINTMVLTPSLSKTPIDEGYSFSANKTLNNHNEFFELAIIFNEKLQQFISFFSRSSDQIKKAISELSFSEASFTHSSLNDNNDINTHSTTDRTCK